MSSAEILTQHTKQSVLILEAPFKTVADGFLQPFWIVADFPAAAVVTGTLKLSTLCKNSAADKLKYFS